MLWPAWLQALKLKMQKEDDDNDYDDECLVVVGIIKFLPPCLKR